MIPPLWIDDLLQGLLVAGSTASTEHGPASQPATFWCVLTRGELVVKLHHDRQAWDIIVGNRLSAPSADRWSNRTTSVHLLRAVHDGTINVDDAGTANAQNDGRWLLANLATVSELVALETTWRDMNEFDRAYMAAQFDVVLPARPGQ